MTDEQPAIVDVDEQPTAEQPVVPPDDEPIPATWEILAEIEADLDLRGVVVHPVTLADVVASLQRRLAAEQARTTRAAMTPEATVE